MAKEFDFQTTDPVTGLPRGRMGGNWQTAEDVAASQFGSNADIDATDAARELAGEDPKVNLASIKGTGAGGRITVDDVRNAK